MQRQISGKYIAHNDDIASWAFDPPARRQLANGLGGPTVALGRGILLAVSDVLAFGTGFAMVAAGFRMFAPSLATNMARISCVKRNRSWRRASLPCA